MSTIAYPKVSVVILSYNFEKYLAECIESILNQTLRPWEIIICDDYSLDNSWEIICKFKDLYPETIKAFRQERNVGPARNANVGLQSVKGDVFAWIDGDDRWLPQKIEMEWKALEKNQDAQIAYSNVYVIDPDGHRSKVWYTGKENGLPTGDVFAEVFSKKFFPTVPGVFRNELRYRFTSDEVGYMDEALDSHWDWDLKIRLTSKFRVAYSEGAFVEYRKHHSGFVAQSQPQLRFKGLVQIYEKNLPLLDLRSKREAIQIKCEVESYLATLNARLNLGEFDAYSVQNIYDRCASLLTQLPKNERRNHESDLVKILNRLARLAAKRELKDGNWKLGMKYLFASLK